MPNPEHLHILKQGVEAWNEWRKQHPDVLPYLTDADLHGIDLGGAHFRYTHLARVNLGHSNLSRADLIGALLNGSDLTGADLNRANLTGVKFGSADLSGANLRRSELLYTIFQNSILSGADFTGSRWGGTILSEVDLSEVKGLETVEHAYPSTVGFDTAYRSWGEIPDVFLRGCGLPESFIVQMRALVASTEAIQFYSCFISHSSRDQQFARRLHADLQSIGVRCWFAPEDLKIGDRFRDRIDESIRLHDKLLLILSENSVSSPWVSDEVESAMEREHRERRTVLFPIKIDEAVMESTQAWAASIRRTRHIGDFTGWKDHDSYKKAFDRLLRALKAEETNKPNHLTPNSLENRAVLSPRNTLTDAWDEVEDSIIQLAKREGLVKEGELVDCGQLVNQLHEAGKIADAVRERFFTMSKVHFSVAFNSSMPVEPGMAIDFVNRARELQKALAVDTPPLR